MKKIIPLIFLIPLFCGCGNNKKTEIENPLEGEITITADEALKPIVDAQIMAYKAHYPKATINIKYVPEQIAMAQMMNDSSEIAIVTREFNQQERNYFEERKIKYLPAKMALDAVDLVVNEKFLSNDISTEELASMMTEGNLSKNKLVFDNSSSSNLNLILRKLNIQSLNKQNIFTANGTIEVFDYVKKNSNAIGFIGNTWVSDKDSKKTKLLLEGLKIIKVGNDNKNYYGVDAKTLRNRKYPFERLIMLHTKQHYGMAKGFIRFCCAQIGQLVVEKAGMIPYYIYEKEIIMDKKSVNDL